MYKIEYYHVSDNEMRYSEKFDDEKTMNETARKRADAGYVIIYKGEVYIPCREG